MVLSNHLNDLKQQESSSSSSSNLIETIESRTTQQQTTANRNRTILQICLTLEVISTTSRFFSLSNEFSILFLIDNLYFTLENYLSPNVLIRCVATRCLHELARNLNFSSPQRLLSANYDFIMNDLVLKSNNLNRRRRRGSQTGSNLHSSHALVLCALIRVADADICPYLERLVDDYLFAAQINSVDQHLIESICSIVGYMTESMRRWYPVKFELLSTSSDDEDNYDLSRLDLEKFAFAKKKHDEKMSFVDGIREVDQHFASLNKEKSMWEGTTQCETQG